RQFEQSNFAFMGQWEREAWAESRTPGFIRVRLQDVYRILGYFLTNSVFLIPLVFFGGVLLKAPRLRVLRWILMASIVAVVTEVKSYEHYAAPLLIVVLILAIEAFRHFYVFELAGKPVGRFLTVALPAAGVLLYMGHEAVRLSRPPSMREPLPANARRHQIE